MSVRTSCDIGSSLFLILTSFYVLIVGVGSCYYTSIHIHALGLLWTRDRPVAETTYEHTTLIRN